MPVPVRPTRVGPPAVLPAPPPPTPMRVEASRGERVHLHGRDRRAAVRVDAEPDDAELETGP